MPARALRPPMRDAIVDAAIDTFARNPGASLSDVARRAGVGRASLHRYFPSRGDLVTAISRQCMDEIDAATAAALADARTARERLSRMMEAVVPLGDRYHFLATEAFHDESLQARYEEDLAWVAPPGGRAEGGRRHRPRRSAQLGGREYRHAGVARLVGGGGGGDLRPRTPPTWRFARCWRDWAHDDHDDRHRETTSRPCSLWAACSRPRRSPSRRRRARAIRWS